MQLYGFQNWDDELTYVEQAALVRYKPYLCVHVMYSDIKSQILRW